MTYQEMVEMVLDLKQHLRDELTKVKTVANLAHNGALDIETARAELRVMELQALTGVGEVVMKHLKDHLK